MKQFIQFTLGILLSMVSIGAIVGGSTLMISSLNESMDIMKMPIEYLDEIPLINSWFIPGLVLFSLIGIGNGWAALICFRSKHQSACLAGLILGIILVLWIGIQILLIGYVSVLQPIFGGIGLLEIILAIFLIKFEDIK